MDISTIMVVTTGKERERQTAGLANKVCKSRLAHNEVVHVAIMCGARGRGPCFVLTGELCYNSGGCRRYPRGLARIGMAIAANRLEYDEDIR